MYLKPLLKVVQRTKKELLDYKNSSAGKKEIRLNNLKEIKKYFNPAYVKRYYEDVPSYMKFAPISKSKLGILKQKHALQLSYLKKAKKEFLKKDGKKVLFTNEGLLFKSPNIEKQFYKDLEKHLNYPAGTEPVEMLTSNLGKKYGYPPRIFKGKRGSNKFGPNASFGDYIIKQGKKDIILKNPKKYGHLTEEQIKLNKGKFVGFKNITGPKDIKDVLDKQTTGSGLTFSQINKLKKAKTGSSLDTGHANLKGKLDDLNIEKNLDDFIFQPQFINRRMIRPAERVRDDIARLQKDTLKGVLKHYTKDGKVMFGKGFKPGVSDAEIESARKLIHNLNDDLDVIRVASNGQVRGVQIDPRTFEPLEILAGSPPLGSISQRTGLGPIRVKSLSVDEVDDIAARMSDSVNVLEGSSAKYLHDMRAFLRNPKYAEALKNSGGSYSYEDMVAGLKKQGVFDDFVKQTKSTDFSELPGFDYTIGTKTYRPYKKGGRVGMSDVAQSLML